MQPYYHKASNIHACIHTYIHTYIVNTYIHTDQSDALLRLVAEKAALLEDLEALKMATGMDYIPKNTKVRATLLLPPPPHCFIATTLNRYCIWLQIRRHSTSLEEKVSMYVCIYVCMMTNIYYMCIVHVCMYCADRH